MTSPSNESLFLNGNSVAMKVYDEKFCEGLIAAYVPDTSDLGLDFDGAVALGLERDEEAAGLLMLDINDLFDFDNEALPPVVITGEAMAA